MANFEEEIQLAFIENEVSKYLNSNSSIEDKLKSIFEKSYGSGNIEVNNAGKNYKVKVKNTKTAYRVKADGTVEKYEEMDPTSVYARLDDDGTLYLRATEIEGYKRYIKHTSIKSDWNTFGNASKNSVIKVIIEEPIAPNWDSLFEAYNNLEIIENMRYFHTENMNSMAYLFYGCSMLTRLDVAGFDTNNVTSFSNMFSKCNSLVNINVTGFDTSNVRDFNSMFSNCNNLVNIDVTGFNTENAIYMNSMFARM